MADKLIKGLTTLGSGSIENEDWLEIQEDDASTSKKVTVEVLNEIEAAARAAQDDVIEAGVGLNADGTYNTPSGTNYLDSTTDVMDALDALDNAIGSSGSGIVVDVVQVTAANLNNSGLTPYEIITAPGANKYIELLDCSIWLDAGGTPTECGTQKLVLEFDTGSSHFMEWSNSFIESSSDIVNKGTWTSEVEMKGNKKVQLTFDGGVNATAGTTTLKVWVTYIIRDNTAS